MTSLTAQDKVALDLPAPQRGQPSKGIKSNRLVASGDEKQGLTAAVFSDGVEYREFGGTPAVQRVVRSRNLDAVLKGGFAEISDARFTGNVQFNDGGMQASAADVRYKVAAGSVDITGKIGNALPHVQNDQIIVDSGHIEMVLDGPKMTATEGPVRTVLKAAKAGAGKDAAKMPGLMQQDRDVNGSSDKLVYDGANGSTAEFTGNARLFQGETLRSGAEGFHRRQDGEPAGADGAVKSTIFINDVDRDDEEADVDHGLYGHGRQHAGSDDAARRMSYETTAHLRRARRETSRRRRSRSTFAKDTQDVKTLEATTAMTLKESGRVTTGDKLLVCGRRRDLYDVRQAREDDPAELPREHRHEIDVLQVD